MPEPGPAETKRSIAAAPKSVGPESAMPAAPAKGAAATAHLDEVATILALGIHRRRAREGATESSTEETVPLDFTAHGSGHGPPRQREVPRP